jgi:hypothetical protein
MNNRTVTYFNIRLHYSATTGSTYNLNLSTRSPTVNKLMASLDQYNYCHSLIFDAHTTIAYIYKQVLNCESNMHWLSNWVYITVWNFQGQWNLENIIKSQGSEVLNP